jgi:hypothetical protein
MGRIKKMEVVVNNVSLKKQQLMEDAKIWIENQRRKKLRKKFLNENKGA